ncbi:HAMP domain-containing sensor histidine kinase [Paraglaciecola sp.]|uniref:sensor histidine kinase n=1 Tax=Paraglaciecola sp. TaxID=1920173 RepID=UPI0032643019
MGAYEIQLGGKMHELNYLHQKYITKAIKSVEGFKANSLPVSDVEEDILHIQEQPIRCIRLVTGVELFIMKVLGTHSAIDVCKNDIRVTNDLLQRIQAFKDNELDKASLLKFLNEGIADLEQHGTLFEPLIRKTVQITFLIVISLLITQAFVVPIIGIVLSRSVANDYILLLKTKLNLEQEKKRSALIQSQKMTSLNTLVAGVAHEVNTPVGVSISATSLSVSLVDKVQRAFEREELTEDELRDFFTQTKKINDIVSGNLLRTSTLIESFKQVSVDQTMDDTQTVFLIHYIEKVLLTLTPLTKSSDIKIELIGSNDIKADIHGGALSQIITNLVTNTVKHAFKNSRNNTIFISLSKSNGSEIHLRFEDNGCGIPKNEQTYIFDPFFTTKRGAGGTGLGLHIVYNLVVEKLKGRILCSSTLDEGATFDIYFPTSLSNSC